MRNKSLFARHILPALFITLIFWGCGRDTPDPNSCGNLDPTCPTITDCCTQTYKIYLKHQGAGSWLCTFPPNQPQPSFSVDVNVKVWNEDLKSYKDWNNLISSSAFMVWDPAKQLNYIELALPMKADMVVNVKLTEDVPRSCCKDCGCLPSGQTYGYPIWNASNEIKDNSASLTDWIAAFSPNPTECKPG